jgi:transposase
LAAFVKRVLEPSLRPGQIVILDNLSMHKSARATTITLAAGCQLVCLLTSSPDLNPIEPACVKTKQAMRCVVARLWERVVAAVGDTKRTRRAADAGFARS